MKNLQASLIPFMIIGICCCFTEVAFSQSTNKVHKLDKDIEKVLEYLNCPGAAVAVVEKDKVVYARGFGYSDFENKVAADPNTLFAIGSCTKSFTAALVGQLQGEGHIDLEASPKIYLPSLSFYNDEMNEMITVRDMLCHSTGLPRHDLSWYYFPTTSRDSLVQRIKYHEPTTGVRRHYQYNNFMYMACGNITEVLSDKSWEQLVQEQLFEPLGMERSNLSIEALQQTDNVALGYHSKQDGGVEKLDYHHILGMAPAGAINSSAAEMGNWLITWINRGTFNGQEIIPASFVEDAIRSQVAIGGLPGKTHADLHMSGYGFGWTLLSYRGHYRVEHGGNIDGFSASICFFPSDSVGIVVLTNQNYSRVPALVRNMIADQILGLSPAGWNDNLKPAEDKKEDKPDEEEDEAKQVSNKVKGTQPSHPIRAYEGTYLHKGYGSMKVKAIGNALVTSTAGGQWWLRHYHYDVFEVIKLENGLEDTADFDGFSSRLLNFSSDVQGEIQGFRINMEGSLDPLTFKRQIKEIQLSAKDLERYTGEYSMGGTTATIFINTDGELILRVPGQPDYTLIATDKHKFTIADLEGYSVKFSEKEGKIDAAYFVQPNGTFRIPRK